MPLELKMSLIIPDVFESCNLKRLKMDAKLKLAVHVTDGDTVGT